MGILERIKEIEQEMDKTQRNKATEGHLGMLKARLAKLRSELLTPSSGGGGGQVIPPSYKKRDSLCSAVASKCLRRHWVHVGVCVDLFALSATLRCFCTFKPEKSAASVHTAALPAHRNPGVVQQEICRWATIRRCSPRSGAIYVGRGSSASRGPWRSSRAHKE